MPDKNYAGNSGLSAVFGAIKSVLNNKVDKEAGKGLSTNDYTDEEKATLAGKQDELTFDNIPTENSTNPVKSGGVYSADEAIRKWTTAEAKSVSGNPITLLDGSARNAEGLVVTFEPKQSGSGTPSPTNVRPITGYTECVVDRDGFNVWDEVLEEGTIGGATGQDAPDPTYRRSKNYIPLDGESYYFYISDTAANSVSVFFLYYDANKNYIGTSAQNPKNGNIFQPNVSGAKYARFCLLATAVENKNICFNISNTAKNGTYEPYHAPYNVTITFGQTVYGGSVDFKTGKVTVTHTIVDLGTLDYTAQTNISSFYAQLSDAVTGATGNVMNAICSQYKAVQTKGSVADMMSQGDGIFAMQNGSKLLFIKDTSKADLTASQFADAMDGVQLCYELATPTELTLTPAELELLKGYNYISTNGTTIALAYLPDSLLAEAENYVDDADSVLNAKIDEIDGRVDSIEAMSYHTASDGTKTVTLTNVYQQIFISISIATTRTIYLVVQQKANTTVVETIFSTAGKTPIDIAVTRVSDNSFTITIPQFAQTNIISTEPFSVG